MSPTMHLVRQSEKPISFGQQQEVTDSAFESGLRRMPSDDSSPPSTPTTLTVEVHPVVIRKTPKFPTRERHLAIRRKKVCHQVEGDQEDPEEADRLAFRWHCSCDKTKDDGDDDKG